MDNAGIAMMIKHNSQKALVSLFLLAAAPGFVDAQQPPPQHESPAASPPTAEPPDLFDIDMPRPVTDNWKRFSELPLWEEGLSEMSYFDAACTLYKKSRHFTRVHLMNRQFMDERRWIKASPNTRFELPAFKMLIAEQVPTENYNYRFLTSVFLERPSLQPIKVSLSSQEWCGTTFKILQWTRFQEIEPKNWSLDLCSYSYFPDEGDVWIPRPASVDAYESLYLFARAVVASGGQPRKMNLLKSMRSNRDPDPNPVKATLRTDGKPRKITVPFGSFQATRVVLDWSGPETWFDVESNPPYRLLAYQAGDVKARLKFVERRAYWDRSQKSAFYEQNHAP